MTVASIPAARHTPNASINNAHDTHLLLEGGDGLAGVEALGAGLGAVHDRVAAEQLEGVVQLSQALLGQLVAAVLDPSARTNMWK
jgi:hypothetical protein